MWLRRFTCHRPCYPACVLVGAGTIVNIGSTGGRFTTPGAGAYHISKYGVEALSLALRAEVAQFGVRVVLIDPTGVRTRFVEAQLEERRSYADDDPYGEFKRRYDEVTRALTKTPGVMVNADTVARAVVRAVEAKNSKTPLYRRCVWKSLRAGPTAADRPDVGACRDEGLTWLALGSYRVLNIAAPGRTHAIVGPSCAGRWQHASGRMLRSTFVGRRNSYPATTAQIPCCRYRPHLTKRAAQECRARPGCRRHRDASPARPVCGSLGRIGRVANRVARCSKELRAAAD